MPGEAVEWERRLLETAFPNSAACNDPPSCFSIGPLRWRRVYAMGRHAEWTDSGVRLALPPKGVRSAVYWDEVGDAVANPAVERRVDDDAQPFYDYPHTGAVVNSSDGHSSLQFPLLTYRTDATVSSNPTGIALSPAAPIGMTGPLGWLGVPSVLYHGGGHGLLLGTAASITLDVMGAVLLHGNESVADLSHAGMGAVDNLTAAQMEALDDRLLLWGRWGHIGNAQGIAPPALSGNAPLETRLSELSTRLAPSNLLPHHPLLPYLQSFMEGNVSDFPVTPDFGLQDRKSDPNGSDYNLSLATLLAVEAWEYAVTNSLFGGASGSFESALFTHDGFAPWPGHALQRMAATLNDLQQESVLLLPGGCLYPLTAVQYTIACA